MSPQPLVFRSTDTNVLVAPRTCGLVAVPDFLHHLRSWCDESDEATLVVDLSDVEELDMTMFRTLLWARRYCTARGRELVVVATRDGVLHPDDEPMVRAMLPTYPDAASAQETVAEPDTSMVPA